MTLRIGCHTTGWLAHAQEHGVTLPGRMILQEVSRAGYRALEFAGDYLLLGHPFECDRHLEEHDLRLVAIAGDLIPDAPGERSTYVEKLDWMQEMKVAVLVVTGGTPREGDDPTGRFGRLLEACDATTKECARRGIAAAFRNRSGSLVQEPDEIQRLLEGSRIGLCLDVGELAAAGLDPVPVIDAAAARVAHGHLGDGILDREGKTLHSVELGAGNAGLDFRRILARIEACRIDAHFMVGQDQVTLAPAADAARSRDFLVRIGWGDRIA